jgi:two-component system sensor histidine kinase KdpD
MVSLWAGAGWPWAVRRGSGYLLAVGLVALVTAAIGLIPTSSPLEHRSPVYLTAVLATGALFGRGPAIAAAVLSFVAFDWFFVAPAHTLHVADPDEWQALLLFLLAAVVTGHLTALLRGRAELAHRRERETVLLYEMGKTLAGAASVEDGLTTATERLRTGLALVRCEVLLEQDGRLRPVKGPDLERNDQAAALWVLTHALPAWRGESEGGRHLVRVRGPAGERTLLGPGLSSRLSPSARRARGVAFLPLVVEGRAVGVLLASRDGHGLPVAPQEEARLLASVCDQLALSVERGRLQRETVQAEVLKRTDALRAALLSSVSHDLRSPLAAIKAAAGSLLQQDVAWDEVTRSAFAAQIEREADRLNRLVGNLLDLSRIEAGALVLDRQWYPLGELVDDTVMRLGPLLAHHRVQTTVPQTVPPVLLDYLLIQQVLANLVENAAKYAPQGTCIRVSAEMAGAYVRVRVEDEGPGLPAIERERIFEPFYRVARLEAPAGPPSGAAGPGPAGPRGTGLGLAVCAGFVAAHGGRIWVEPAGTQGAAFIFELPATAAPAEPPQPVAPVGTVGTVAPGAPVGTVAPGAPGAPVGNGRSEGDVFGDPVDGTHRASPAGTPTGTPAGAARDGARTVQVYRRPRGARPTPREEG